jgi:hypothetical protein
MFLSAIMCHFQLKATWVVIMIWISPKEAQKRQRELKLLRVAKVAKMSMHLFNISQMSHGSVERF